MANSGSQVLICQLSQAANIVNFHCASHVFRPVGPIFAVCSGRQFQLIGEYGYCSNRWCQHGSVETFAETFLRLQSWGFCIYLVLWTFPKNIWKFLPFILDPNYKKLTTFDIVLAQQARRRSFSPKQGLWENHQIWRIFHRFDQRKFWTKKLFDSKSNESDISG